MAEWLAYTETDIIGAMKPLAFLGDSKKRLREFPDMARRNAGQQLQYVQSGRQPKDFKPMPSIGAGVEELRIRDEHGAFRVVYMARRVEAVYVLHVFQKKTQQTSKADIDLARQRFQALMRSKS